MESNEWQMGSDYYSIVGNQIRNCFIAQREAKADATLYDEWYEELIKLDMLIGNLFTNKKDIERRNQWTDKIEKVMKLDVNYTFNLNLNGDAKTRRELHKMLIAWTNWLLEKAHKNNLLIKRNYRDPSALMSSV